MCGKTVTQFSIILEGRVAQGVNLSPHPPTHTTSFFFLKLRFFFHLLVEIIVKFERKTLSYFEQC